MALSAMMMLCMQKKLIKINKNVFKIKQFKKIEIYVFFLKKKHPWWQGVFIVSRLVVFLLSIKIFTAPQEVS